MLLSHRYKFIVIDIPKTGTRSFRMALQPFTDIAASPEEPYYSMQHETAKSLKLKLEATGHQWANYFKIVRVRNPWQRYVSYLQWARDFVARYQANPQQYPLYGDVYRELVCKLSAGDGAESLRQIITSERVQADYFLGECEEPLVDYVIRVENIDTGFQLFCEKVGLPKLNLPQENKSTPYDYRELCTDELIELVAQKESYVIEQFNYTY